ncbi:MAG: zinc ribbon domain-containing protein [Candidatus Promineifilaceae bacterium]
MSTVTCPNCKAPNTEGSKFCNRCGASLPRSTHVICPNCKTRNPRNLLYCDNCGTRLLVTGELSSERIEEKEPDPGERTPRAFSLPAREPGDELELDPNGLFDWLRTGGENPEENVGSSTSAESSSAEQESVLDDWLSELSDVEPSDSGSGEESSDQPMEDSSEDDIPLGFTDWLAKGGSVTKEDDLMDWLSELDGGEDAVSSGWSEVEGEVSDTSALQEPPLTAQEPPSAAQEPEEALPDWLNDSEDDQETVQEETDLPDWLNAFDAGEGEAETAEPTQEKALPDWLVQDDTEEETPTPISSFEPEVEPELAGTEELLPDWLNDFNTEDETPTLISSFKPSEPETAENEDLPDWMNDFDSVAAETESAEGDMLPDWLNDFNTEEETPTLISSFEPYEAETTQEEALPDWLNEFDSTETEAEAESAEGDALPDWLNDFDSTETEAEAETAEEEALPDWLNEVDAEEETPTLISSFESETEAETVEEALPDWLNEIETEEEALADIEGPNASFGEETILDWLNDLDTEEEEAEIEADLESFSDWDSDLDEEFESSPEFEQALESADTEDDDEVESTLPDWLAEMPQDTGLTGFLGTEEGQEETADILADLGGAALTPVDELPDWLADVAPVEEAPQEEIEETAEVGEPDWLSEFPVDTESLDSIEDIDWLSALSHEEIWPEVADDEEIIAQLDDLEGEPAESTGHSKELKGIPKELAGPDLPNWLQEDMPESPVIAGDEDADIFAEGTEQLVQEELPDWLKELKPAAAEQPTSDYGLGGEMPLAETRDEWQTILENMPPGPSDVDPGASGLSAAEIPAWLQALRPGEVGELKSPLPEIDEEPETEGPLAGLKGVLPVAPVITKPVAAKNAVQYTISKDQQQQIALLHQLTHEEPAATKRVSQQKATAFSPVWRILLALLLFLVVLTGVLLPRLGIAFPEMALPVPQSTLDAYETIDGINGQTVLVAFDYTPAMAGELDPAALMLLRHLAENGNRVLTISQSAVGTAIAGQLVGEVNDLDSSSLGLLTGEAIGLRSLESCLNSAANCQLLFGSASETALQEELSDVGLIVLITGDRNSLINWIEQVASQNDVPVVAAVTQPLGPLTIPYLSSGQLKGSIDGIPAASAYEKRLRGQDGSAFELFTAQTIVLWVVIAALVVASLFYGLTGFAGRKKQGNG